MRLFFESFVLGLSVAAPVGPIGLLCIRRTMESGLWLGFACGLGAATADAIYGLLAAFGTNAITSEMMAHQRLLQLIAALFVAFMGISTLRAPVARRAAEKHAFGVLRSWLSTFALTIVNPATILSFAALFATMVSPGSSTSPWWLVTGVFLGSMAWWLFLSTIVDRTRSALSPVRLRLINVVAGCVLVGFAVRTAWGLM
jgi:threonine/homoserine/homoserine lactone efflux protein